MTAPDPTAGTVPKKLPVIQLVGGIEPLRYGQAVFNDAYRAAPDLADQLRGGDQDPFYFDERVVAFLSSLLSAAREAGREEGREEERGRIKNAAREFCRRCRDEGPELIEPAAVILWGKLLPPEHLGPRCEFHAAEAIGWDALRPDRFEQWAGFDLRPLRGLPDA